MSPILEARRPGNKDDNTHLSITTSESAFIWSGFLKKNNWGKKVIGIMGSRCQKTKKNNRKKLERYKERHNGKVFTLEIQKTTLTKCIWTRWYPTAVKSQQDEILLPESLLTEAEWKR